MRVGHDSFTLIVGTSQEEFLKLFQTMTRLLEITDEVKTLVHDTLEEGETAYDDFVDAFDGFMISREDADILQEMDSRWFSKNNLVNHYFRKMAERTKTYVKYWDLFCGCGASVSQAELKHLETVTEDIAAKTAYLLYHEYQMERYFESLKKEGGEHEVDAIVDQATKLAKVEEGYYFNFVRDMVAAHPAKLEVFDAYPELEPKFQSVMGPLAARVDYEFLTLELVNQVLDEEITPEELIKICEKEGILNEELMDETEAFSDK